MRRFCVFVLLLAFATASQARSARKSELELAATADIIIVGVVSEMSSTPAKKDYLTGAGRATLAVKRVIAGSPGKTIAVQFPTPPKKAGLRMGLTLKKSEKRLFFLIFGGDGYHIEDPQEVRPEKDADRFAQLIKEMPVRITLTPLGQVTVGKPFIVTVQISNRGKKPLEYRETTLMGYTTLKPAAISFSRKEPKLKPEQPGTLIKPGEKKIFNTVLVPAKTARPFARPQKITCRAVVWMKIIDPKVEKWPLTEKNLPIVRGFYAATSWATASLRPAQVISHK